MSPILPRTTPITKTLLSAAIAYMEEPLSWEKKVVEGSPSDPFTCLSPSKDDSSAEIHEQSYFRSLRQIEGIPNAPPDVYLSPNTPRHFIRVPTAAGSLLSLSNKQQITQRVTTTDTRKATSLLLMPQQQQVTARPPLRLSFISPIARSKTSVEPSGSIMPHNEGIEDSDCKPALRYSSLLLQHSRKELAPMQCSRLLRF
jgi:hypothetical protein